MNGTDAAPEPESRPVAAGLGWPIVSRETSAGHVSRETSAGLGWPEPDA